MDANPDYCLALSFSMLPLEFAPCLHCVCKRWAALAADPFWKPELILYAWGAGACAGHGSGQFVARPRLLHCFYTPNAGEQIVALACSNEVTLAVAASGALFQWGELVDRACART